MPRIVAAAGVLAAATICAVPPPAAATVAPSHVGLVVAGQGTYCVAWHAGMSGIDVLTAAGLSVSIGQRQPYIGFVLGIGGGPSLNPSVSYWAYYQLTATTWHYSDIGAGGDKPAAGSVEGWAVSPTNGDRVQPAITSYASLCASDDQPATMAAAPKTSEPVIASSRANVISPSTPADPASASTAASSSVDRATEPTLDIGLIITSPTVSPAAPSVSTSRAAGRQQSPPGSPLALIIAGCLVAALLAGGGLTAWRRHPRHD